jgi:hypothetical protein
MIPQPTISFPLIFIVYLLSFGFCRWFMPGDECGRRRRVCSLAAKRPQLRERWVL